MEYKYPPLPYPQIPGNDYTAADLRQYAEQAVAPLLAEIERLKRGEFICNKCYLRKDAEVGTPDF